MSIYLMNTKKKKKNFHIGKNVLILGLDLDLDP
jgi:hypothetical protein